MSIPGEYHGLGAATEAGRVREAIEEVVLRALEQDVADRKLARLNGRMPDLDKAEIAVIFAARRLTRAIDARPLGKQPPGWAEWDDRIIDPDCRAGKHRACAGDPCECSCHASGEPGVRA